MAEAILSNNTARARLQQARVQVQRSQQNASGKNFALNQQAISRQLPKNTGSKIDLEAFRSRPRNAREEERQENEKRQKELDNKKRLHIQKMQNRAMLQNYLAPPQEFNETFTEAQGEEESQQTIQQYQQENADILASEETNIKKRKLLAQKKQSLQQQAQKAKETIEKARKAKDLLWTAGQYATLSEHEGAAAGSVFSSGFFIGAFRIVKKLTGKKQILTGTFAFLEPAEFKMSDITSWLSLLHTVYSGFMLMILAGVVLCLFILLILPFAIAGTIISSIYEYVGINLL